MRDRTHEETAALLDARQRREAEEADKAVRMHRALADVLEGGIAAANAAKTRGVPVNALRELVQQTRGRAPQGRKATR